MPHHTGLVWRFSRFVCSEKIAGPAGDDTLLPLLTRCHLSHLLGAALPLSQQLSETTAPANPGKKQQTTKLHQFFLNSFLSAAICCRAWGKSIKTEKLSPLTSDTLPPSWGGFQGLEQRLLLESAGRRERRQGREKGKKWTAAKQLSLPPCRTVQSRRQSNSAWCLSSFSRLVPAWYSGKGLSDCPLCLTSQRGPTQPQFPKEKDLGWWCFFFSEEKHEQNEVAAAL